MLRSMWWLGMVATFMAMIAAQPRGAYGATDGGAQCDARDSDGLCRPRDTLEQIYASKCATALDINEHLPTLKRYAEECDVVVEMGVRSIVSTWAFLAGQPQKIISVDIMHPKFFCRVHPNHDPGGCQLDEVYRIAAEKDINFEFIEADTLEMAPISCDLLFIDTLHDYNQLKDELRIHSSSVRKYIILHDTEAFGVTGETGLSGSGIWTAVEEFLAEGVWEVKERFRNNNGLTVLSRAQ